MNTPATVLLAIAAVWLTAALVADGLPAARTARALRRRTGSLFALTGAGLAAMASVGLGALITAGPTATDRVSAGLTLPAVPAVLVAGLTVRRLRRVRAAAGVFTSAPETPAPPTLRAAAAHPMIAFPVQATGLAALPGAVTATGLVPLTGPTMIGSVLTAAVLMVGAVGVRHALRHSRLAEQAVTLRSVSPRATGVLYV